MSPYLLTVSTPSRICLFGEHQDYLGLEVIALAVDLRFYASATLRSDRKLVIHYTDTTISSDEQTHTIDLDSPIVYRNKRDYMNSAVNVLLKRGVHLPGGVDIYLRSDIPIGKGMCSSTTLVVVLIKLLLELAHHPDRDNPHAVAQLGFQAEVEEFFEPGGKMDHYTSALGGLVRLDFKSDIEMERIRFDIPGRFILFDSGATKDTIQVLANAKTPVLEALDALKGDGILSVRDFACDASRMKLLDKLPEVLRHKLSASIDNYNILREAASILNPTAFDARRLGQLLNRHHANLRDGLGISTRAIEDILDTAIGAGALGGKINGSGGGGCCFAYATQEDTPRILEAVRAKGYWARELCQDAGMRLEDPEG
nr:galactokinase family protein [bacterium]